MFTNLKELTIPEGKVTKIEAGGKVLWQKKPKFTYVSFGDSIAAGQYIRREDRLHYQKTVEIDGKDVGLVWTWQYGTKNPDTGKINESTEIIEGTYTQKIRTKLEELHGKDNVSAISYAYSGDENHHLRDKLEHANVQQSVRNASLITVCIGANTMLGPALEGIGGYAALGTPGLQSIENEMTSGLNLLKGPADDENGYGSYLNIFSKLASLNENPDAKFIFTTIYNPFKYLYADKSTSGQRYTDGFFGPVFNWIPDIDFNIPGMTSIDVRKMVYEMDLLAGMSIQKIIQRINDPYEDGRILLADWIDKKVSDLNQALYAALEQYELIDSENAKRFIIVDTHALCDSTLDVGLAPQLTSGKVTYNQLTNVAFNHNMRIDLLNWGNFWDNWSIEDALKNCSNANNFLSYMGKFGEALGKQLLDLLIKPDMDPHPRQAGHDLLYRAFAEALGWDSLNRYTITYNLNGGSGAPTTQKIVSVDKDAYVQFETYNFAKSNGSVFGVDCNNASMSKDSESRYFYGYINSNVTANVVWGYKVTYYKSLDQKSEIDGLGVKYAEGESGPMEGYSLAFSQSQSGPYTEVSSSSTIQYNGTLLPMEPYNFNDSPGSVILPEGTWVKVWVRDYGPDSVFDKFLWMTDWEKKKTDTAIYKNDSKILQGSSALEHRFKLTGPTSINFVLFWRGAGFLGITGANDREWQCHITTT